MLEFESKEHGAELISIRYNGIEKLHQADKVKDENGNVYWNRYAPVLFPIVGQIKNGETLIENKVCKMGQHGFARDMNFKVIEKNKNVHKYLLKFNEETFEKYPYKFELYITYKNEDDILKIEYEILNIDDKDIYFGIGAHPAFICDYKTGDYELAFKKEEKDIEFMQLENGLMKKNNITNLLKNNQFLMLNENSFDNDAIIMKNIKSKSILLRNKKENKNILEVNFDGFNFLGIWSKKGAPFVCIEPWMDTADFVDSDGIFKNKEKIIKLERNKNLKIQYNVKFY